MVHFQVLRYSFVTRACTLITQKDPAAELQYQFTVPSDMDFLQLKRITCGHMTADTLMAIPLPSPNGSSI